MIALHAGPRHDGDVVATSIGRPLCDATADAGILAFRVLAHDHPVQLRTGNMTQRTGDARQNSGRTNVGVLVERLADRQAQAPQRDVVRDVRSADGAEQDGVELAELIGAVCRHHDAMLLVVVRSPIEILEVQLELPSRSAQTFRACTPASTTSGPIPSPPMAAIR